MYYRCILIRIIHYNIYLQIAKSIENRSYQVSTNFVGRMITDLMQALIYHIQQNANKSITELVNTTK